MTVDTVLAEAAVYLNDANQTRFTDDVLLPYIKRAWRELQLEMHLNDSSPLKEYSVAVSVPAGATSLGVGQPPDLVEPISMAERPNGYTGSYTPMVRVDYEPDVSSQDNMLGVWAWREDVIVIPGATQDTQVRLKYLKSGSSITDINSPITIIDADLYLAPKTAGLAAKYIGENYIRGNELIMEGERSLNKIIRRNIKKRQTQVKRRRSYTSWLRGR